MAERKKSIPETLRKARLEGQKKEILIDLKSKWRSEG